MEPLHTSSSGTRSDPLIQIALLGEAMEHVPVAVFVFDADGHYVAVNQEACRLLGYTREEVLARRIGDLAADPQESVREYLAVAEGRQAEGTTRVRRGDGELLTLRFRGSATAIAGVTFYVGVGWEA
jgi:PAS domain S-box-containing protein